MIERLRQTEVKLPAVKPSAKPSLGQVNSVEIQ
jgi:hypothetical protein